MTQEKYDCEVCLQIWRMLSEPDSVGRVDLGCFDEVTFTRCQVHGPLLRAFVPEPHAYGDRRLGTFELVKSKAVACVFLRVRLPDGWWQHWKLLLIAKDTVPAHPGIGRILNAKWADLDIISKWKDACLTKHGAACENPMKIERTQPEILIDVASNCLVRGCDVQSQYVALSYVWGNHRPTLSGKITRAELFEPNSLRHPDIQQRIFPIIGHAMKLTGKLGERYLWVDALCVDQDDQEHTGRQLRAMASIYANAVVTLINTDGDSETGIPGLKDISRPRAQRQAVFQFGDEQICVRNTGTYEFLHPRGHEYFERGWTYQEYNLSSRRIIFLRDEAHWECQCAVWHEELVLNTEVEMHLNPFLPAIIRCPDLFAFSQTIKDYNEKTLTYAEDALPAISGLLTIISRSFTGGFLFGLPEMFFSESLSWIPVDNNLKRRSSSERPMEAKLLPCDLPSWSWIGWQGRTWMYRDTLRIDALEIRTQETFPITEWSCGKSPRDPPSMRRVIRHSWYEQREKWKDLANPIPPGWTRYEISTIPEFRDKTLLHPEGCGQYAFKHAALSDSDSGSSYWWYPFPVPTIDESTPCVIPEQWPYLFCRTESVRAWTCQEGEKTRTEEGTILLHDASGAQSGSLLVHNEESFAEFPSSLPGREIELVALHRANFYSKTYDKETKTHGEPINETKGAMCVLWVEWENGVAFRRGCGHVNPGAWPTLNPKEIDLVLG